ncbi:MAG TPA: hypothetical protein VHW45_20125 [Candidatus Sulfotelmatobacter sp.]|jgi:hypothetical protein|nr:hypothetical protein [Candidatus Sulfotelmatobacter sp.]
MKGRHRSMPEIFPAVIVRVKADGLNPENSFASDLIALGKFIRT